MHTSGHQQPGHYGSGAGRGTVATTSALAVCKPENAVLISESGIQSPADVRAALAAGADGVLVGTAIWMAEDPVSCYRTLSIAENTDR